MLGGTRGFVICVVVDELNCCLLQVLCCRSYPCPWIPSHAGNNIQRPQTGKHTCSWRWSYYAIRFWPVTKMFCASYTSETFISTQRTSQKRTWCLLPVSLHWSSLSPAILVSNIVFYTKTTNHGKNPEIEVWPCRWPGYLIATACGGA